MFTNDPHTQPHPDERLDAYALDALDKEEAAQVEFHLSGCPRCRSAVADLQRAVAHLGQAVGRREPPHALRLRLMEALDPVGARAAPIRDVSRPGGFGAPALRVLVPIAAAAVVILFTLAVLMNLRLSGRLESVELENSALTAQVAQSTDEDSQVTETLHQLQLTSYWLANPANRPLTLKPPSGVGDSRGILLMADDGRRAVLILTGMEERSPSSKYQVWLMREGTRVLAGVVKVDDQGWGTAMLQPDESLFRFDKVELTTEKVPSLGLGPADKVLEGNIPASKPSQKLIPLDWQR